jgi:hypothetical protein
MPGEKGRATGGDVTAPLSQPAGGGGYPLRDAVRLVSVGQRSLDAASKEDLDALLQAGADAAARNADGMTPLSLATALGHADVARLLRTHAPRGSKLPAAQPAAPPAAPPPPPPPLCDEDDDEEEEEVADDKAESVLRIRATS